MIHPDPARRPSTSDLIKHPVLLTAARKKADQLRVELNAEKFKNALLIKYVYRVKVDDDNDNLKKCMNNMQYAPHLLL